MKNRPESVLEAILNLPRFAKQIIAFLADVGLCIFSFWIAYYLRLDEFPILKGGIFLSLLISIILSSLFFSLFGLYKTLFRYSDKSTLFSITLAIGLYALIFFCIIGLYRIDNVPRSISIIQPLILYLFVSFSRLGIRFLYKKTQLIKYKNFILPNALIYGAGSAGRQLFYALDQSLNMSVVGFVDDNKELHGRLLYGKYIFPPSNLRNLIKSKKVTHILLAMPSVSRNRQKEIISNIDKYNLTIRKLPSVSDLIEGKVKTLDIKELDVEDILHRDQIKPNIELLSNNVNSKVVLITGAGGSVGSELSRQILKLHPKKILLLEVSEFALYEIYSRLNDIMEKTKIENVKIIPLIGSIQDKIRMEDIIKQFNPDTIYHSAAYKHVPLIEENIYEGIKNNVFGTLNIAKISLKQKVKNFILISSDKAVRPTNIMGASKRLAEICIQSLFNKFPNNNTKFSIVRFGNVIDSSGSVIPKFRKQILDGGPITLTHPDVTRYFMTIPEAAELVIQASAMSEGSEVFLLDMGKPIKILDLVKKIIKSSGLTLKDKKNEEGDIEIKVIGLRPGEKLFEELLLGNNPENTLHPKIKKAREPYIVWEKLEPELKHLENIANNSNIYDIKIHLKKLIPEFSPNDDISNNNLN